MCGPNRDGELLEPPARGIDLPERVRYVILAGVLRMEIPLSWDECNPTKLLALIRNVRGFLNEDEGMRVKKEPKQQESSSIYFIYLISR